MKNPSRLRKAGLFVLWLTTTAGLSYAAFIYRADIEQTYTKIYSTGMDKINAAQKTVGNTIDEGKSSITEVSIFMKRSVAQAKFETERFFEDKIDAVKDTVDEYLSVAEPAQRNRPVKTQGGFINASYDLSSPPPPLTLSEIKRRKEEDAQARLYADIMPAAAPATPLWTPEQPDLDVEAVLVPRQVTVISSSQDGRIAQIPVNHGDYFKKGDLLVAYDCSNIRAEADIAKIEKTYTEKRLKGTDNLFKLDIISDLDRAGAQIENQKATVKDALYQARLRDCDIRAEFDGRVTNRLANPGEYTRTDRVLLEVASDESLQAEFLIPSKWLRWVNVGAPVSITVSETENTYTARIVRIHGEVDPVSQSIQMIATLDPYQDRLLPGMSGKALINVDAIRDAGVQGYLEVGAKPGSY